MNYIGSKTLGQILPQLAEARDQINDQMSKINEEIAGGEAKKGLITKARDELTNRQNELNSQINDMTTLLDQARQLVSDATTLVSQVSDALGASGFHMYTYSGQIQGFDESVAQSVNGGLPGSSVPTEQVFAVVIIAGGDGGAGATAQQISALTSVMGI